MNSMIIPASYNKLIIVKIGNSMVCPTIQDVEFIRDWIISNRDTWLPERKKLRRFFGYDVKIKCFPEINSNKEFVRLIKQSDESNKYSYFFNEQDIKDWTEVFNEADNQDFILFEIISAGRLPRLQTKKLARTENKVEFLGEVPIKFNSRL